MADQTPQNLQNHSRYDPMFHFVLLPLLLFHLIYRIYQLVRFFISDNMGSSWETRTGWVLLAFALLLLAVKVRNYSLRVQDRVIRVEERLRLVTVLPEPLRARVPELKEGQLIALRFAPDEELAELVKACLDKKLAGKEIKQSIKNWRPDYWRV
jgi:hypothetical protein